MCQALAQPSNPITRQITIRSSAVNQLPMKISLCWEREYCSVFTHAVSLRSLCVQTSCVHSKNPFDFSGFFSHHGTGTILRFFIVTRKHNCNRKSLDGVTRRRQKASALLATVAFTNVQLKTRGVSVCSLCRVFDCRTAVQGTVKKLRHRRLVAEMQTFIRKGTCTFTFCCCNITHPIVRPDDTDTAAVASTF
jgi:hypothetical protein